MEMSELFDDAVSAYRARLVKATEAMGLARDPKAFVEAERELFRLTQELAGAMTERVLQEVSDDKERRKDALRRLRGRARPRGVQLRVERSRRTPLRTLSGQVIEVVTPYATARPRGGRRETRGAPGTGVYYVLDELGIAGRSTPALRLAVSRAVCEANSVTSARELLAIQGTELDHKAALRLTYSVTELALQARREAVQQTTVGNPLGPLAGRRVVVSVDGGRVNVRRRVGGPWPEGGRRRFETEWREPKVLTVYVLDEEGKRDKSIRSVIDGTLGDADEVFALLRYHLLRLGAHRADEVTLVADGAPWIWHRADGLRRALGLARSRFHEVVDYFHVVERLGEISQRSLQSYGNEAQRAWLRILKRFLKAGDIEAIERSLSKGSYDASKTDLEYLSRNRDRMRYADFRRRRLPVGSGAVESAVRRVINLRLKGSSIFWTEEHAEGILHLRAYAKSGRWAELEDTVLANTGWRPTARLVKAT